MMMTDDARSDFVLAAAGAALIPMIAGLVVQLPPYQWLPSIAINILGLGWVAASLMLVPWIITKHREQGLVSYSLMGDRPGLRRGALVAMPIVLIGFFRAYSLQGAPTGFLGLFGIPLRANPVVGSVDLEELLVRYGTIIVVALGVVIFSGFLISRAKDAFREVDLPVVEALRTYGMGAVGVAVLTGLLVVARGSRDLPFVLGAGVALFALVLLADRLVFTSMGTTRAAILAPAIATAALHIMATGGPLGGDLLLGLWWGSLGFGLMVVAASLAASGATRLAWVIPVLATALWPSCMSVASIAQVGSGFCA